MSIGTRYGLCLGLAISALLVLAPQPLGATLAWSALAAHLAVGAILVWRRTRLPYATAALVLGACNLALLAYVYGHGYDLFSLPLAWAVLWGALFVMGVVLMVVEPRANPQKWQAWRAFMQNKPGRDVLLGRHIPTLRSHS